MRVQGSGCRVQGVGCGVYQQRALARAHVQKPVPRDRYPGLDLPSRARARCRGGAYLGIGAQVCRFKIWGPEMRDEGNRIMV